MKPVVMSTLVLLMDLLVLTELLAMKPISTYMGVDLMLTYVVVPAYRTSIVIVIKVMDYFRKLYCQIVLSIVLSKNCIIFATSPKC